MTKPASSDRVAPKPRATAARRSTAGQRRAGPTDISDPQIRQEAKKALVWLGIAGLIALTVTLAQPLMVVFGGMVFGALVDGGARALRKFLHLPRALCVALVLLFAVGFTIWFVTYAGTQMADQAAALPATMQAQAMKLIHYADRHGLSIDTRALQSLSSEAFSSLSQLTGVVGGLIGGLTTLFLIMVLGVYFAIDPAPYQRGLAWMLPRESRPFFEKTFHEMGRTLRRLLLGRVIGMTVEGVSIGVALGVAGVPMASLLGLISGLLAFLPNIGAPISGLIMVMVGFSGGVKMGLYCIGVYVVVQGIDGNVIVPMVAKKTADLAPALVLAMQLIMGALFGILGLALADPLLAMLKVLLERLAARGDAADDDGGGLPPELAVE